MSKDSKAEASPTERPRRDFMWEIGAVVVGTIPVLAAAVAALGVVLDPLLRKGKKPTAYGTEAGSAGEGFTRVAAMAAIPPDGIPRRFSVIADRQDAWNFTPNQPIGAVYMSRQVGDEDGETLQVLHATCPHAGCSVATAETPTGLMFQCPCHNSSFAIDGKRVNRPGKNNPSPRDLDDLEIKIESGDVWVAFKDYYTGREVKEAKI
jgi:menaquinol-cytochrome c reductase iron-sulfur subunit